MSRTPYPATIKQRGRRLYLVNPQGTRGYGDVYAPLDFCFFSLHCHDSDQYWVGLARREFLERFIAFRNGQNPFAAIGAKYVGLRLDAPWYAIADKLRDNDYEYLADQVERWQKYHEIKETAEEPA